MTGHNELRVGGLGVAHWLTQQRDTLVAEMLVRIVEMLPTYGRLPDELLHSEVRRVCENAVGLVATAMRTDGDLDPRGLAVLQDSAARRAEEGVPMDQLLAAYHLGADTCLARLEQLATPEDLAAVVAASRLVLRFLRDVTAAVALGYSEERQSIVGEEIVARQSLLGALLDGTADDDIAWQAGVHLPASYVVLALAVGAHPDESGDVLDHRIVARRKLRRLRDELARHFEAPVLTTISEDGGLALLPHPAEASAMGPADWAAVRRVVVAAGRSAGAPVRAGAAVAGPARVPDAARLARELLELALATGRDQGVHHLGDLALEYQLSRATPATEHLAALLSPLDAEPELLHTLRTFVAAGQRRRRTAAQLHVHPNTVDNRLRRVARLTGLDATDRGDITRLTAALAAGGAGPVVAGAAPVPGGPDAHNGGRGDS